MAEGLEPGWCEDIGSMVVKVTENWIVSVTPMIYNDRVLLSDRHGSWRLGWVAGFCYDKGGAAALAAMAWDPETERYPVGYKKIAGDSRPATTFEGAR
jgi:hypothetical protein